MQQPGALAAVLELYEEPLLREAHGLLARQRVETTFSVDAVMTQYLKMYSTVASRESHIPLHRIDRPGEQRAALIVR
jgi:hypothetical protein